MEKRVSIRFVVASVAWVTALGVLVVAWVADAVYLGFFGIFVMAGAATGTICAHIREQAAETRNAITIVRTVEAADDGELRRLR